MRFNLRYILFNYYSVSCILYELPFLGQLDGMLTVFSLPKPE